MKTCVWVSGCVRIPYGLWLLFPHPPSLVCPPSAPLPGGVWTGPNDRDSGLGEAAGQVMIRAVIFPEMILAVACLLALVIRLVPAVF